MKNKEWLKEQIKHEEVDLKYAFDNYVPYEKVLIADDVNELLNQLEEPEQEKVVIPQFVADRIEEYRKIRFGLSLIFTIDDQTEDDIDFSKWLSADSESCEKVARAWIDGYTVEKFRRVLKIGKMYFVSGGENRRQEFNIKLTDNKESAHVFESEQEAKHLQSDTGGELEEITK